MPRFERNHYTIVELLVIIAIIAILAGLLIPVLSSARRKTQETACFGNMRQIGIAITSYRGDYIGGEYNYPAWLSNLYPKYISKTKIFQCPFDPKPDGSSISRPSHLDDFSSAYDTADNPGFYGNKANPAYDKDNTSLPSYYRLPAEDRQVSYFYEFNQHEFKTTGESWCEMKVNATKTDEYARRLSTFPVVRCFWHAKKGDDPVLNLSVTGNVLFSKCEWEKGVWVP